jgi:putative polyhydroxyalkanoate system protein
MPKIKCEQRHGLPEDEARESLLGVLARFGEKYGFQATWEKSTWARVTGRGVKGAIELRPGLVVFDLDLSLFLSPLRAKIEAAIAREVEHALRPS